MAGREKGWGEKEGRKKRQRGGEKRVVEGRENINPNQQNDFRCTNCSWEMKNQDSMSPTKINFHPYIVFSVLNCIATLMGLD